MNNRISNLINEIDIDKSSVKIPTVLIMGVIKCILTIRLINFIDLNRNYLDPEDGLHPDGNPSPRNNIF